MPIEINKKPRLEAKTLSAAKTLLSKISPQQEKLAALLKEQGMPAPLITLVVNQCDPPLLGDYFKNASLSAIVGGFTVWSSTKEGVRFWKTVKRNMAWLEQQRSINISSPSGN